MTEIISIILLFFFFHTNKFRAEKFKEFALLISMFKMFKIHSMKIPNHMFMLYLHNFQFFYSGFPHLDDKKRAALLVIVISNFLLSSFTLISISYPEKMTMFWIFYSLTVGRDPKMITISWSHYDMLPPWGCSIYIFFNITSWG